MLPNILYCVTEHKLEILPNMCLQYYRTYTRNITEHIREILPNIHSKYYRTYTRNITERILEYYRSEIQISPPPNVVPTLCPSRLKLRMVTLSRNRTMGYRTAMGMLPNSNVHVTEH